MSSRLAELSSHVLEWFCHAFIVVCDLSDRRFFRLFHGHAVGIRPAVGWGFAPDPRIFRAWTDAPNNGFDDAEGRIPGVGGYALVCFCDIVGRIRSGNYVSSGKMGSARQQ